LLETARLRLRPLQAGDAAAVFRLFADPEVVRYYDLEQMTVEAQAAELIARQARRFESGQAMRWGIAQHAGDTVIGTVGYVLNAEHASAGLGYDLASPYWRRGIMSEALRVIINYGFKGLMLHRIQALVMPGNEPSIALLEKLGFTNEGLLRDYVFLKGRFHDMFCFSLLAREWPGLGGGGSV
jgi:[ribosomal protein S5]-alanine N-acetyltransferase